MDEKLKDEEVNNGQHVRSLTSKIVSSAASYLRVWKGTAASGGHCLQRQMDALCTHKLAHSETFTAVPR